VTEEEFRSGVRADGTRLMQPCTAVEYVMLVDALRAEEGWAVMICHDNPDEGDNCCVVCEGSWIKGIPAQDSWHPVKLFYGDTVIDCLRAAHAEMIGKLTI
jgi:hypothetical protein